MNAQNQELLTSSNKENRTRTLEAGGEEVYQKSSGRWSKDEHKRFVEGLIQYGKNWKKVEEHIGTRTGAQIRSHAQKFFNRVEKDYLKRNDKNNIDKLSDKKMSRNLQALRAYNCEEPVGETRKRSDSVWTQISMDNLSDDGVIDDKSEFDPGPLKIDVQGNNRVVALDRYIENYSKNVANLEENLEKKCDNSKTTNQEMQDIKKKIDNEKAMMHMLSAYRNVMENEKSLIDNEKVAEKIQEKQVEEKPYEEYQAETSEDSFFIYMIKKLENYLAKIENIPFNPKLSDLVDMVAPDESVKSEIDIPRPRKNSFKIFHDEPSDKNNAKLANLRRKISLDMDFNYKVEKKLKAE